jgi:4-hydroxy-tetrahydrodipicolinate reductase
MRIALFGYGKMGHMIEQTASLHGSEVVAILDPIAGSRGDLGEAEICVDFTEPGAVIGDITTACMARLPIVVGTTGWYDHFPEARRMVEEAGIGLVHGSNFSIGVNLMFRVVSHAADLFSRFQNLYDPFVEEAHHKHKKDAPSGTALDLKQIVESEWGRDIPVASTRAGYMPGLHRVGFDSEADDLVITHTARGRAGFAEGALLAAKWVLGRRGFYDFTEVMDERLVAKAIM